jgi:tetratricopeptide (TPR) repeat protein
MVWSRRSGRWPVPAHPLPCSVISSTGAGGQLTDLGRREDALAAVEEAAGICRELAAARPDAFRPDLASSLNNLAIYLGEMGRREDALAAIQKAVTIRRELAARWPFVGNAPPRGLWSRPFRQLVPCSPEPLLNDLAVCTVPLLLPSSTPPGHSTTHLCIKMIKVNLVQDQKSY